MKVSINNLNNEGQGVCRVNGKVTFVPYALCGEVVDINIVDEHKKYNINTIDKITLEDLMVMMIKGVR